MTDENTSLEKQLRDVFEIEGLDQPDAEDPRTENCLPIRRIQSISFEALASVEEEGHLSSCKLCQDRREAFRQRHQKSVVDDVQVRRSRNFRSSFILRWSLTVAVAATVILAVTLSLISPVIDLGLDADCAGSETALFSTSRGTNPGSPEFWIGVRLKEPAWIVVVAELEEGQNNFLQLGLSESSTSIRFEDSEMEMSFGPYKLTHPPRIKTILVLASKNSPDLERLRRVVREESSSGERLSFRLEQRLNPEFQIREIKVPRARP